MQQIATKYHTLMKKALLLFVTLLATATAWADDFITDVMVIGGNEDETNTLKNSLRAEGWTVITKDLNADAGGDYIFLLYKTGSNENNDAGAFITDFYISTESGTAPDIIESNGRIYHLVNFDGGSNFIRKKGDLNSNAGGAYIHLYYTKDDETDYSSTAINSISFSATASGGVCENGGTTPCDLNKGCGSSSEYIYMHVNSASKGWLINTNGTQCTITGYAGNKSNKTAITIPLTIDGAIVSGFSGQVFSGFNNLKTITFNENTIITQMPLMQGCNNLKHVNTDTAIDQTPLSMTSISAYAFAGTNLETINMLSVTNVGEYAFAGTALETIIMPSVTSIGEHAFDGCRFYQITLPACLTRIGSYAFSNCSTLTDIYFDGTQQQWNNVTKGDDWKPNATIEHWHCTVTFNSNGHGTAPAAQNIVWSNQDKAVEPTAPTAPNQIFLGWYTDADGNNKWDFNNIVTGDMTLYAKWEPKYTFNSETGELKLIWGEFNNDNKWGSDVPAEAVKSVTATNRVSFNNFCSDLFSGFSNCTSMDLKNVNTSNCIYMSNMFSNCSSLTSLDLSGWNTGNVTNMSHMFSNCKNLTSLNLSGWNTSSVTSMYYMFEFCIDLTSLDLSGWNTGNVSDMNSMFSNCRNLTSLDISGWNTGNVRDMNSMFKYCKNLTSLDLSGWDTGNVRDMNNMFSNCSDLTSINLSGWNTSNVTKMNKMFYKCSKLTKLNLAEWNTSNVSEMSNMFYDCSKLTTIYVGDGWTTENVTSSDGMFSGCNSLVGGMGTTFNAGYTDKEYAHIDGGPDNPGYLTAVPPRYTYDSETGALTLIWGEFNSGNKWGDDVPASDVKSVTATSDVSFTGHCGNLFSYFTNCTSMDLKNVNTDNCTNMRYMFRSCTSLTSLDLSGWNTSNVTDMCSMFGYCTSMTSLDLTGWNTGKVTDMRYMFQLCSSLDSLTTLNFNTGNVTSMGWMFHCCSSLTSLDLSGWNTGNVTDMNDMFSSCSNLTSINLSGWNTSNVTRMTNMFENCSSLTILDLSDFNTVNVTSMSGMFRDCSSLTSLDLLGWNTGNVSDMKEMFYDCSNLTTIYVGDGWNTGRVNISAYMFRNCNSLVGGMGTTYDDEHINAEYAHIDGGTENPGYLTAGNTQIMLEGVQFADNHFATWYGAQNLAVPEGLEAYVVSDVEDDKAIIVPVDYIPAGVGVLLYSETSCENISTGKYHGTTETVTSLLVGRLKPQTVTDGYLLYNDSFVRAQSGTTLPAHRCYLSVENPSSAPSLLRIIRPDDGVITGIDNVKIQYNKTGRYNLMGQPVGPDYRGIVIQNGKKVIVR